MNLGDVPTWIAAIGTSGAFGASLYLLWRQGRDRRAQAADARRAQARMVTAWTEGAEQTGTLLSLRAWNGSDQPVYDAMLCAGAGVRGTYIRRLGTLVPAEMREVQITLPGYLRASVLVPAFSFIDSAGIRWLRTSRGELIETPTGEQWAQNFHEDPGAYNPHPTLHAATPEEERGRRIM